MADLLRALITFVLGLVLILCVQRLMHVRRLRRQETLVDEAFGVASLSLPSGWRAARELNAGAGLQVIDPFRGRYAIVFTDFKSDFVELTLDMHSQLTRERLASSKRVLGTRGPWHRSVDGCPALQFELDAIHENTLITYLHTTVATQQAFHQVLAWATSGRFSRDAFEQLLDGFHEVHTEDGLSSARRQSPPVQVDPPSAFKVH